MRRVRPSERFVGARCELRLLTLADCTERYVGWLRDPEINRYLETRWSEQNLESVRAFVGGMVESADSYLFAIVVEGAHVGNIKIGPIQARHRYADVSYFIGERAQWGRGIASDAIALAAAIGFERLGLHRVQAGLYEGNVGSGRALEKAGFRREGVQRKQLRLGADPDAPAADTQWEDHVWYGLLREEWQALNVRLVCCNEP
jgi:RimJ/RimL family protein N-acetyltransferase